MTKLQYDKINRRYHITIPIELVRHKGWFKGDDIILMINTRGNIEIVLN